MLSILYRPKEIILVALPGEKDIIIEDEVHMLSQCPFYKDLRAQLDIEIQEKLRIDIPSLFHKDRVVTFANYLKKSFKLRFPEKNNKTR